MKPSTKRTIFIVAIVVLILLAIILAVSLSGPNEISWTDFTMLYQGNATDAAGNRLAIEAIAVGTYRIDIKIVGSNSYEYYCYIPSRTVFLDNIAALDFNGAGTGEQPVIAFNDPSSPPCCRRCWCPSS